MVRPASTPEPRKAPANAVRFVTAASLFDGHDAAINIMRRILQSSGVEVVHLGHNRSVADVVRAAIQEDVQGVAVSSYQGGHMEYFKYLRDQLEAAGVGHVQVFGGGGGTIVPEEKAELEAYGVARIYHPEDGRRLGLQGMIDDMIAQSDRPLAVVDGSAGEALTAERLAQATPDDAPTVARALTLAEAAAQGELEPELWEKLSAGLYAKAAESGRRVPVVGLTGTGGAGKSSLTDELVRRYVEDYPDARVAVLSVDPTKRRTGGALLGDRIRMNSLDTGRVFMRSLATRGSGSEVSPALGEAIRLCQAVGFDLVVAETSGIGQADAQITDLGVVDVTLYVMTPEFGAQTQLEKIEMIDLADLVVVNKYDKPGAEDALRDVRKAYQRAHEAFMEPVESMPVFATNASQFGDRGTNTLYKALVAKLGAALGEDLPTGCFAHELDTGLPERAAILPPRRVRYLAEVSDAVRKHKARAGEQAEVARELWAIRKAIGHVGGPAMPETPAEALEPFGAIPEGASAPVAALMEAFDGLRPRLDAESARLLAEWPALEAGYRADQNHYEVRGRTITADNYRTSLAGQKIPRVALPRDADWGQIVRWRHTENVPGQFPFTAGVFPYKRTGEDPARMFAGEGGPWRTNKRFHYLSAHAPAKRLSTAFDSVTLYGEDPDRRPDIWGKVGNSGVSIATVEDMEALYAGFDLADPRTSVSMTINGPAPTLLAFFFNAAARQGLRKKLRAEGRLDISEEACLHPDGGGHPWPELRAMVDDATWQQVFDETVKVVRGTVQADILKEDQAQNTCIFSTEFSLRVQGDMQQWFIDHGVRNFYSVSISGYHIAEAGANPITQLAFTLANGFTFVEYFRARGMDVDRFAPNLSFFFSNGMDPEYAVIGRVARRIWSVAMRELYGASERSQKLKYHVQTSGRSLHAQEIAFNDIRTTLQALLAVYDNANSLHTNAYDEAVTTPTEESVRRALAIQLILAREFGVAMNENPNQGAFIVEELTELVENAVLAEFDRLTDRGGVLGAMERMYQRSKIQDESLYYEHRKHTGDLPIVGVNTFTSDAGAMTETTLELVRSSDDEKADQLARLEDFHARHANAHDAAVRRLKDAALTGDNLFDELVRAVEHLSLGQITQALYEVGGQYRRNM